MNNPLLYNRMLQRIGGWSLLVLIAIAQLIALLGAIPGILSIQANTAFSEQQLRSFAAIIPFLIVVAQLILLIISWQLTPSARKRLGVLSNNAVGLRPEDEFLAWREITSLGWRYGIAGVIVIYLIVILPLFLVSFSEGQGIASALQPTTVNGSDPIYVLLGGAVALLGFLVLAVFMIDRLTLPLRLILLPKDFESQLKGRSGLLLKGRLLLLTLVSVSAAIMLTAPTGFHYTVQALYGKTGGASVFGSLQWQSIIFGIVALAMGAVFTYYLAHSVSDPISDLIQTLNKIEQGDLTQRVPVSATDELGIVTMQFNRMVARLEALQSTLEHQVLERTKQLTATNEVGRVAASSLDPEQLLARIGPLFHNQFGYYFAAIYLLDRSGKWAELKEATGEAGKVLKQNRHRLEVAGQSMVGTSIRERSPRIAQVASDEKQRFDNPLLPYTRSEIALPLMVGDRVLGALNVQSSKEADFGPQVIETMKNMAGQVAIALENARLFQEAQQVIREMRTIQQQYLFEGWSGFSEENKHLEYHIGDEVDKSSPTLEAQINLRDQILGQIVLEGNEEWTPDQQSLVDAIATQAAVALENARLVSESRQIAMRERMVAEINSKVWASTTIDGVLQTAVKELGRRLNASSATVELNIGNPEGDKI
jgi:GAF domain-containing protein/HAMP domain-containing protein